MKHLFVVCCSPCRSRALVTARKAPSEVAAHPMTSIALLYRTSLKANSSR